MYKRQVLEILTFPPAVPVPLLAAFPLVPLALPAAVDVYKRQDVDSSDGTKTYRYYFNGENEGWAATGWQYLEKPEDDNFEDENPFEDEAWFWFGTNGRAAQNTTKYIGGQYYTCLLYTSRCV